VKLRVNFQAPQSVTVELNEEQERLWHAYQAAGRAMDQCDWFTNHEEYDRLSDANDEAWEELVYGLNLETEDAEGLVDEISTSRW